MALHHTVRRLSRLALSVAAVFAVTACAAATTETGTSETSASEADSATPVTLSFAIQVPDPENGEPQIWAAVKAFEEQNPNITVELTGQPVAEHLQRLQIAGQSDTLPDMFWIYDANARELNEAGKLLNIRPILEEGGVLEYYPDTTVAGFSDGDVMYGQPSGALITGLWYNKAILEENGLEVPVTFDDLLEVSRTLSAQGITTISNGSNQATFSVWSFLRNLSNFGWDDKVEGLLDGSVSYNNADFAKLYEHIAELRDAGAFADNVATTNYDQIVARFTSGEAAFVDGGIWMAGPIQESPIAEYAGFWIGPEFSDGVGEQKIAMNVPAAPFAYSAKSAEDPNKLAAMEKWIVFWAGQEAAQIQVDFARAPSTTWEVSLPDDQFVFQAALEAAFAEGNRAPSNQPDLMVPTSVATAMYDSIYGVILGQLTPDEAMNLVQAAIDAL